MMIILLLLIFMISSPSHSAVEMKYTDAARAESIISLRELQRRSYLNEIVGLEIWLAAPKGAAESSFGHSFLRFVTKKGDFAMDPILGFYAEIGEANLNLLNQALIAARMIVPGFPKYKVLPIVRPLVQVWNEYVLGEGREIKRFIITADSNRIHKVIGNVIQHMEKDTLGEYNFFGQNCTASLTQILLESGIGWGKTIRPMGISNMLFENGVNLFPELTVHSQNKIYQKLKQLNPQNSSSLFKNFSDYELQIIRHSFPLSVLRFRNELNNYLRNVPKIPYEVILDVAAVPHELYQICKDYSCAQSIWKNGLKIFDPKDLSQSLENQKKLLGYFPLNAQNGDYWVHLLKLVNAFK